LESGRPAPAANGNANGNLGAPNPPGGAGAANPQGAVALFNRVWNAPGQAPQAAAPPAQNGQAQPPPPLAQLPPPFPWHAGQINQAQWAPQPARQFQGFNAGGAWHPWGAPPAENERGQRTQDDSTPIVGSRGAPLGLVSSPAPIERDVTPMPPPSGPAPPVPTPVQQVIAVPNKTPPEAKEGAKASDPNAASSGSGSSGTSAREAAALAALRRFQAGRSTDSLKSPPGSRNSVVTTPSVPEPKANPRASPAASSGVAGAAGPTPTTPSANSLRAHAPNLIPLYNPGSVTAPGPGMWGSSPYFAPVNSSSTALIDLQQSSSRSSPYLFGQPSSGPHPFSTQSNLPRSGQLPSDLSDAQLRQLDRVTRETIDERLRVLEDVQSTVWRCVEELTRLRSALPDPVVRERGGSVGSMGSRGVSGHTHGGLGSMESVGVGSGPEVEALVPPDIQVESAEPQVDTDLKGKGKAAEADDAPVVDTDVDVQ
jgi:E3 ubiquitin-protein ligase synoviolin